MIHAFTWITTHFYIRRITNHFLYSALVVTLAMLLCLINCRFIIIIIIIIIIILF